MIRRCYFYLVLPLLVGCATTNPPDSEFSVSAGPELEGPFASTALAEDDIRRFKLTAMTKFQDITSLSKTIADTTLAKSFRDTAFDAWIRTFPTGFEGGAEANRWPD